MTDSIKFTNDEVNNLLKEVINFYKELRKIEVNANRFNLEWFGCLFQGISLILDLTVVIE